MELAFTEQLIIKSALMDKRYLTTVSSSLEKKHFTSREAAAVFDVIKNHYSTYKELPTLDMVVNSIEKKEIREEARTYMEELNKIEFDIAAQFDFIVDATDSWLKQRAIQHAIMDSADIISKGDEADYGMIRKLVEEALIKTLKIDLGLDYFGMLRERFERVFSADDTRIPTYFPAFDEYISGGFPPFTFSVISACVHAGKSQTMLNFMGRQVLNGHNVVMFTLEMSEDVMAQRLDGIFTGLDINRMYTTREHKKRLVEKITAVANDGKHGTLWVKQYPPTSASVNDFRSYLHELSMRGFKPDIIYCDYINLMKPAYQDKGSLYEDVKRIGEELRGLSFEYRIPVVSVTQVNRGGMRVGLEELDFSYIAESVGTSMTADFMAILGIDQDMLTYANEIHYKILKNRLGGRIGSVDKLYIDDRSLKMYDSTELDLWIAEANESGGARGMAEHTTDARSE